MREMAENYELDRLWVFQKHNSIAIFYQFFGWCTNKHYITYRINFSTDSASKEESHQEMQHL
jgi:predicted 3-demethylubiquinone-9 3-methyltransferase (glyoxalase superfamily)